MNFYKEVDPKVYDEVMRVLNFNEPYFMIDMIAGTKAEGNLEIDKEALICDFGCGTGQMGRLLARKGYKNITGIDPTENVLKFAHDSGNYKETRCMYLGMGNEVFPDELRSKFDIVTASGIWVVNHCPAAGMEDAISALKVGGYFVTSLRKMYWINGEACGYKDIIDKMVSEGRIAVTKKFEFKRGIPDSADSLYQEMESVLFVCQKLQ